METFDIVVLCIMAFSGVALLIVLTIMGLENPYEMDDFKYEMLITAFFGSIACLALSGVILIWSINYGG